jgi:uncharacterized membrane-anchored protein YhcB (DUF1043 family)
MLKGNLATRPFYNDRLVAMTLMAIGVLAALLTAFNATQLLSLSKERGKFDTTVDKYAADTQTLENKSATLKSTLDVANMKLLRNGADEANDLIDKRTFSWSQFLGLIESTLPLNARLVEVSPKPVKNVMNINITVVCKTSDDLIAFVDALEKTNQFKDVVPTQRNPNDDGTQTALVETVFLGPSGVPDAPRKTGKGRP